ncbi:hypothetical protein IVB30_05135 [Bradyrhizobium sp. 200]|uniref:hypothetical protein n=1 Tax=Bradyrhizobium sp. 200 TaxID=2782665 RepID=UPI001FFE4BE8|nr:hypothetical protein [Bradyrhizobium sp. 200]UPJ50788.1 hypothetical protein IVB30_05135 [Bradyrhizobium sp. 200]
MEARDRHSGNKRYCSDACRFNTAAAPVVTSANAAPCEHCGTPFEAKGRGRKQRFCQPACRVAHFKANSELETEGIPVAELDPVLTPRRHALARLIDRFEPSGDFVHFTPPTWINPADRRAGR